MRKYSPLQRWCWQGKSMRINLSWQRSLVIVGTERFLPFPWHMTCLWPISYSVHCAFLVFYWTWPEVEPCMVFGVVPPFICWKSVVQPWNGKMLGYERHDLFFCNYLYPSVSCVGPHSTIERTKLYISLYLYIYVCILTTSFLPFLAGFWWQWWLWGTVVLLGASRVE